MRVGRPRHLNAAGSKHHLCWQRCQVKATGGDHRVTTPSSDCGRRIPDAHGFAAELAKGWAADQMGLGVEGVVDRRMDREETLGAVADASGVQQFRSRRSVPALGSMDSGAVGIKGEAIPIRIARHGLLVLTLAEAPTRPAAFGHRWPVDSIAQDAFGRGFRVQAFVGLGATRPISVNELPLVVYFPNPAAPSSVAPWSPTLGVNILAAKLRLTRAPITKGVITRALPWLDRYIRDGLYLDGEEAQSALPDRSFATTLSPPDFQSTSY
jgi:hypothetical protein